MRDTSKFRTGMHVTTFTYHSGWGEWRGPFTREAFRLYRGEAEEYEMMGSVAQVHVAGRSRPVGRSKLTQQPQKASPIMPYLLKYKQVQLNS